MRRVIQLERVELRRYGKTAATIDVLYGLRKDLVQHNPRESAMRADRQPKPMPGDNSKHNKS
jgi:hypothetical protein